MDDVSYNNAYDSVKHDGQRLDVTVSDAGARKGSNHGVPGILTLKNPFCLPFRSKR